MISFKNFLNESNSYEHDLPPAPGTHPIPDDHIRFRNRYDIYVFFHFIY